MTQTLIAQEHEQILVNTIRGLAMDGPQRANSGHPGTAMALAPIGWALFGRAMHHDPTQPDWTNRDRFILSCGHACILQYSLLHLSGYAVSRDDLLNFRQWGSPTPGHPEVGHTPGVETTTGPLGQGFATAVGMALAERFLAAHFNRDGFSVVDHHTYVLASDGDLMEGVACEASSLAGHLALSKLIVFWDDNKITIEGSTDLAFSEDVDAKYEAMGWHVQRLDDSRVNDLDAICEAIEKAKNDPRPSLISCRTHIAYPSPNAIDTADAHGSPLGDKEISLTKEKLGLPADQTFYIPEETGALKEATLRKGAEVHKAWQELFEKYRSAHPELATQYEAWHKGELPKGWDQELPDFADGKARATRASSGEVLQALAKNLPNLIGGSADLAGSTKTLMKVATSQSRDNPGGRNLHYGIREHAMTAMVNGMELHGGVIPFGATFFVFTDYMRPSLRLAALMEKRSIFVLTHDSIGLGEDGPTHQAVEQLPSLRMIPNMTLIRPCDAHEAREAWKAAISHSGGPVLLVLSRQDCPTLKRGSEFASAEGLARGAYILKDGQKPEALDGILIASGYEVHPCLDAQSELEKQGLSIRVVSMPSWELFAKQDQTYRDTVLPKAVRRRLSVEAAATMGWERYVTEDGASHGMDRFGASAPWETNMEKFGFTGPALAKTMKQLLDRK
ncbi:MAG: transketolase [Vulcanimicrobiota bacterium]